MNGKNKTILGTAVGVASGIILVCCYNAIMEPTGSDSLWNLSELDWSGWVLLLTMLVVPTFTGLYNGIMDNNIWKILIFPIIVGAIAFVIAFAVCAVIYAFISGSILMIIACIGFFAALAAPVSRIVVIFFK